MMAIFSDDVRNWATCTLDTFVPGRLRGLLWDMTHHVSYIERTEVGEFAIVLGRFSNDIQSVSFIPDVEPVREYDVPLEILSDALAAESAEDAENLLVGAGAYGTLLNGSDDE